jgi:hypothetical protein
MMLEQFLQRIFRTFRRTFSSAMEYFVLHLSQTNRIAHSAGVPHRPEDPGV